MRYYGKAQRLYAAKLNASTPSQPSQSQEWNFPDLKNRITITFVEIGQQHERPISQITKKWEKNVGSGMTRRI